MPQPQSRLIEIYAERITTTLDKKALVQLLQEEILPSLFVRQSALLHLEEGQRSSLVYADGLEDQDSLPEVDDVVLLAQTDVYRQLPATGEANPPWSWVRLVLPLRLGGQVAGLWLQGCRDPDDFYAQSEIPVFRSLADQTAVALNNIDHAQQLQDLYRANVGREEAERSRLALELHDDVLGQMALLALSTDETTQNQRFSQAYQAVTEHVCEVINTLRPAMLNFGLRLLLSRYTIAAIGEYMFHTCYNRSTNTHEQKK